MSGTKAGGAKVKQTIYQRHGEDFYRTIGALGGKVSRGGGWAYDREFASRMGKIGGKISRRGKTLQA